MGVFQTKNIVNQLMLLWVLSFIFTFLTVNFNPTLGQIYQSMTVGALIAVLIALVLPGTKDGFPIFRTLKPDWTSTLTWGAGTCVVFYLIVRYGIPQFFTITGQSTLDIIRNFVQASALADSFFLQLTSVGFLIPVVETLLLLAAPIYIYSIFAKVNIYDDNIMRPQAFLIIGIAMAVFTLFHIQAKGITNHRDLTVTAIFAVLSTGLILKRQQLADAIVLHIITNVSAVLN